MTGRELVGLRFKGAYSERSGEGGALPDLGRGVVRPGGAVARRVPGGPLGIFLSFLQSHHKQCLYLQSYRFICFSPKDLKVNN